MVFLKELYTNKNKLCNIINNERPSQMMQNQSMYLAPNLIQYGRHITKNNIMDYKFQHNVNKNKISSPEFEEIGLFANYIVGVNIAHIAYLRDAVPYLPSEIWLLIGAIMGSQFKTPQPKTVCGSIVGSNAYFYIEYNRFKVFSNNNKSMEKQYKSLMNQYNLYKNNKKHLKTITNIKYPIMNIIVYNE